MTLRYSCACGQELKAPDSLVGKRGKCPHCGKEFIVPAKELPLAQTTREDGDPHEVGGDKDRFDKLKQPKVSQPPPCSVSCTSEHKEWFVRTKDGKVSGPMTKAELDRSVEERRVSQWCLVLQQGWEEWQYVRDIYPKKMGRIGLVSLALVSAGILCRLAFGALVDERSHSGAAIFVNMNTPQMLLLLGAAVLTLLGGAVGILAMIRESMNPLGFLAFALAGIGVFLDIFLL